MVVCNELLLGFLRFVFQMERMMLKQCNEAVLVQYVVKVVAML